MGQGDLGTCVILSQKDVDTLEVDVDRLVRLCEEETPFIGGLSDRAIKRRLKTYIEGVAQEQGADVAVITSQGGLSNRMFTTAVSYSFSLFKYVGV